MSVTATKKSTLRGALNTSLPDNIPDALSRLQLGELLAVIAGAAGADLPALTSSQNATAAATDLATSEALANALKANYNQLQADVVAIRTALLGSKTEQAVTVTTNVATMAAQASNVFNVNATTGTSTGIKKLIPPNRVPSAGEVSWDGNKTLTFAAADAVTACDVMYAKADGSQKLSILLSDFPIL